ncbi:hypothetical protein WG899_14335 [Paucibacter sp. AS339]
MKQGFALKLYAQAQYSSSAPEKKKARTGRAFQVMRLKRLMLF